MMHLCFPAFCLSFQVDMLKMLDVSCYLSVFNMDIGPTSKG